MNTQDEVVRLAYRIAAFAVEDASDDVLDAADRLDDDEYNFVDWNRDEVRIALRGIGHALSGKAKART